MIGAASTTDQLSQTASAKAPASTSSLSGAVPAQHPARSSAIAATTATPTSSTPAGALASAQNAKLPSNSPLNGLNNQANMAQTDVRAAVGTRSANGTPAPPAAAATTTATSTYEHAKKPSLVFSASGATGYTPNGGPVGQNGGRPALQFGSNSPMPAASVPYPTQTASLPPPTRDPRVTTPAHSPSPIPQPPPSGGRPPSGLHSQGGSVMIGSMPLGDPQQPPPGQFPAGPMGPGVPMHERRASSHSQSMMSAGGRGRAYAPQQPYGVPSPGPGYRQLSGQVRTSSNMPPQFQPQMAPASSYNRGRNSPAVTHAQPNMPPQHMAGGQMPYGYPAHMAGQPQGMYGMPHYDPTSGFYQPYYPGYGQFANQGPPSSPGRYPTPFNGQPASIHPPFHPPTMSRSASQASERPSSSLGQAQTPSMQHSHPSGPMPVNSQPQTQSSDFVKPSQKKPTVITIKDANGNPLDFNKPKAAVASATQAQSSTPLIVGATGATPPPRAPSGQHDRESKTSKSVEDTRNAFQEQVRRKQEEEKRKEEEAAKALQQTQTPQPSQDAAAVQAQPNAVPSKAETGVRDQSVKPAPVEENAATAEKPTPVPEATRSVEPKTDDEVQKVEEPAEAVEAMAAAAAVAAAATAATPAVTAAAGVTADTTATADSAKDDKPAEHVETEDERMERMIAEMEAAEREEEEREKAFALKRQKEKEEAAKRAAELASNQDEELKRQEREAEERELEREREREQKGKQNVDQEGKDLFSELKRPTLGPGASAPESGMATPVSEDADAAAMPPPPQPDPNRSSKPKPSQPLKLDTAKRMEPAEPTPGMLCLQSARSLTPKDEPTYPDNFKAPTPAISLAGKPRARTYDRDFLLQFRNIFKEKPSVDWDQKVKETLGPGDEPGSARGQTARTPSSAMGARSVSGRPAQGPAFGGAMGHFRGPQDRTLPPGTTSQQRFNASQQGVGGMGPLPGQMARASSQLGMGSAMSRTNSLQAMATMGAQSPRQHSARNSKGGGSRRGGTNRKEEMEQNSKMPLTAHLDVAPLQKSGSGWKASSIGQPMAAGPDPSGMMPPDMVQRKVKAALNKMTPEKFDKIADQILEIAAQSRNESDGRTLRQVIQLTFEKACDEAHWAGMYAQFCQKMLHTMSNDVCDERIRDKAGNPVVGGALFRKYLLNRCQEEFERGWQVNLPDKPEGESQEITLLSDEYYAAAAAKRRGLGLIQFIGQLYRLKMLTLRIMHQCVLRLLDFEGDPDEAAVENLTTLLKSIGPTMAEDEQGNTLIATYFQRIEQVLLKNEKLPSRPKFMIMDLLDLRKAGWKSKDDSKGPKTIQQIHQEAEAAQQKAEAERQRLSARGAVGGRGAVGRGDARNFSGGAMPPAVDLSRPTVDMMDMKRLHARTAPRQTAAGLGPSLGPGSLLSTRSGSRRGLGGFGATSSGQTTRTNTPPVDSKEKKEELSSQQNTFSALAALDPESHEDGDTGSSPPAARGRSKSPPSTADKADDAST